MQTTAVILSAPHDVGVAPLGLVSPTAADLVVDIAYSGIATGTEGLFWSGKMPPFPGMGYPLFPGYEAAGTVVEAGT
ncbi:MAG: chlorophyll synthesis pathway protein BchC, partial [Pseudomonadota bacterium]